MKLATHLDSVRAYLQSHGGNYIEVDSMDSLIRDSKMGKGAFTQAFYRLRHLGEIDTDVDVSPGGRKTIKGIRLIKMSATSTIIRNDAEKQKRLHKPKMDEAVAQAESKLPNIIDYAKKKNVIKEITEKLAAEGFVNEEVTINFEIDPLAEEAMLLLDVLGRARTALSQLTEERDQLSIDLAAEKEINRRYAEARKFSPNQDNS